MKRYLVIGAGLSGCVISNLLINNDEDCVVTLVEKREHVGGNCYDSVQSEVCDNNSILIHKYGPHIFHTNNEEVWEFLSRFTSWEPFFPNVKACIHGKEVSLPFNINSIYDVFSYSKASVFERKLCEKYAYGSSVAIYDLLKTEDPDLKELALFIYDNVFKNYVKKQWGEDDCKVDESVMRRVPINISRNDSYFNDKYQAIPSEGYTRLLENMISNDRVNLILSTDYKEYIVKTLNKDVYSPDLIDTLPYDAVFVTSSIDEFFDYKYGVLPYRSLTFREEYYKCKDVQNGVVVSYPNNFDFTRITEHKKFLKKFCDLDYSIRSFEYSHEFRLGENDRYYPIKNSDTESLYEQYLCSKTNDDVYFLGRLGDYKYYNMDIAIMRCFEVYNTFKRKNG